MIRPVVFSALLGAFGLGCAVEDSRIGALATDSVAVVLNLETSQDKSAQPNVKNRDPFDDFGSFSNAVAATDKETPVWLVNQSPQRLIVTAWAGAASVVVDTVGASDSTFVRINTPALTLELSAHTSGGVPMGTVALRMDSKTRRAAFPH